MSRDLSDKIIFLDRNERARLAGLLSGLEIVTAINLGRWWQLCDGSTDYISQKEIESLYDVTFPPGYALDIIRRNRNVILKKVKDSSGRWYACISETQNGKHNLSGYGPKTDLRSEKNKPKLKQKKDKPDEWLSERMKILDRDN